MQDKSIKSTITATVDTIVQSVDPDKIILFGSQAWGSPSPDSDIDFFVVKDTTISTRALARTIDRALWGRTIPVDILVSTPQNVLRRLQQKDSFITDVMGKGKVLYDRTDPALSRVAEQS